MVSFCMGYEFCVEWLWNFFYYALLFVLHFCFMWWIFWLCFLLVLIWSEFHFGFFGLLLDLSVQWFCLEFVECDENLFLVDLNVFVCGLFFNLVVKWYIRLCLLECWIDDWNYCGRFIVGMKWRSIGAFCMEVERRFFGGVGEFNIDWKSVKEVQLSFCFDGLHFVCICVEEFALKSNGFCSEKVRIELIWMILFFFFFPRLWISLRLYVVKIEWKVLLNCFSFVCLFVVRVCWEEDWGSMYEIQVVDAICSFKVFSCLQQIEI